MPRSETLSNDQFSGSDGDPDFTYLLPQFWEAFITLILPPVEGEWMVSRDACPLIWCHLAAVTTHMVPNDEDTVFLSSSNLGAAFFSGALPYREAPGFAPGCCRCQKAWAAECKAPCKSPTKLSKRFRLLLAGER